MSKALVIGIGNKFRGDDAAGLEVAQSLEKKLGTLVDFAYCQEDALDLMDIWSNREVVFLIDAVSSGKHEIGYIHRFLAHKEQIPSVFSNSSTHLINIAQVIELARTLGKLPAEVVLYGIEGKKYHLERDLSKTMQAKLSEVTEIIEKEIHKIV